MPDQPDFWPSAAPRSDPGYEGRERWRRALMIIGALALDGLPLREAQRWVDDPRMSDAVLVAIVYGWPGARIRAATALEFLAGKGLIDAPP
jgi:hypothetical protein